MRAQRSQSTALTGLSISDENVDHVRLAQSAEQTGSVIKHVFERDSGLIKFSDRWKYYSFTTEIGKEKLHIIIHINQVEQPALELQSMELTVKALENAIAVLYGLFHRFESLTKVLDSMGNKDKLSEFY